MAFAVLESLRHKQEVSIKMDKMEKIMYSLEMIRLVRSVVGQCIDNMKTSRSKYRNTYLVITPFMFTCS